MKLVKLTQMEAALAKLGYKLLGMKEPRASPATKRKPMSVQARKAISKATKARWATKKAKTPTKTP